ncbi:hypothetical protein Goshw_029555 [Gossypium schwendimanii]|uniref:Uncharacterized protein n=1 Tax=Gossypium schwendimanii TaxID=34291 RepID=A0A7J9NEN7_GOSSC|nr:hypothetical protein [Gossypium schwendimanii]
MRYPTATTNLCRVLDLLRDETVRTEPKSWTFFPHLLTALCNQAEVLMSENEQFMKPTRSIIRDTLYTQYVKLQRKQETRLVLREFARMNGLRFPNYPPYIFRLTSTHKDEGDNLEEEGAAQEYLRIEDEYEVAF